MRHKLSWMFDPSFHHILLPGKPCVIKDSLDKDLWVLETLQYNLHVEIHKWHKLPNLCTWNGQPQCGRLITTIYTQKNVMQKTKPKTHEFSFFHGNNTTSISCFVKEGLLGTLLDVETASHSGRLPHNQFLKSDRNLRHSPANV